MRKIYPLVLSLALAACVESSVMPTITPTLPPPDATMQSVLATLVYEDSQRIRTNSPGGKYIDARQIKERCGFDPLIYRTETYFAPIDPKDPNSGIRVYLAFEGVNPNGKGVVDYLLVYKLGDTTATIQNRDGTEVCKVDLR